MKKIFKISLVLFSLCFILVACAPQPPVLPDQPTENPPVEQEQPEENPPAPSYETIEYDGAASLLLAKPALTTVLGETAVGNVELYFENRREKIKETWETQLVPQAKEEQNKAEFRPYSYEESFAITLDSSLLLSTVVTVNQYTGGNATDLSRDAQTFLKENGALLRLNDLFVDANWETTLLREVVKQIDKNKTQYFTGAQDIAIKSFAPEDFYIDGESLVLFYPLYSLSAYNEGLPEFRISLRDLKEILNKDMVNLT